MQRSEVNAAEQAALPMQRSGALQMQQSEVNAAEPGLRIID